MGGKHARLSWMKVEDRLAYNLVFYIRNICILGKAILVFTANVYSYDTRRAFMPYRKHIRLNYLTVITVHHSYYKH